MSEQWRGRGEFHRFPHRIERVSVYTSVLSDWAGQSMDLRVERLRQNRPGALSSTGCWTHSRHLWLQAGARSSAFQKDSDKAQAAVQATHLENHWSRESPRVFLIMHVFIQCAKLISWDIFIIRDVHGERPLEPRALWVGPPPLPSSTHPRGLCCASKSG